MATILAAVKTICTLLAHFTLAQLINNITPVDVENISENILHKYSKVKIRR